MARTLHYTPPEEQARQHKELVESMENLKKIALAMADEYDRVREELGMEELSFTQMAYMLHFLFNTLRYNYLTEALMHDYGKFLIFNTMIRKAGGEENETTVA